MPKNYTIQNKIIWRGKIVSDLSASFYPSFYKDIVKREQIFLENFKALFEDATVENLKDKFIPLYQAEIVNRKDFTLERDSIIKSIIQRVEKNPAKYKFLFIHSNDGELYGASLFSITEDMLGMAFKAYRRDINISALKHKASLDYWGEKLIRKYGVSANLKIFSYGRDPHPYISKTRIGLALYKLKTGTKPKMPDLNNPQKPVETQEINDLFLSSQKEPIVFFDNPDSAGFYQNCHLYYPKESLHESFINEFRVVCEWAGIAFEIIES